MERSLPHEASIVLELHLEERIREGGKVIVVNARIRKGCWNADLSHIVFDRKLRRPHWQSSPVLSERRVIGHTRIDIMRYASTLSSIRTCLANGDFITPMSGVDKGYLGTSEEAIQQLIPVRSSEIAFDELNIGKFREFVIDKAIPVPNLRSDLPTYSSCSADERSGLPPSYTKSIKSAKIFDDSWRCTLTRVDSSDNFSWHHMDHISSN